MVEGARTSVKNSYCFQALPPSACPRSRQDSEKNSQLLSSWATLSKSLHFPEHHREVRLILGNAADTCEAFPGPKRYFECFRVGSQSFSHLGGCFCIIIPQGKVRRRRRLYRPSQTHSPGVTGLGFQPARSAASKPWCISLLCNF